MSFTEYQKELLEMVEKTVDNLVFIPTEDQFLELVKLAVKGDGSLLSEVREDLRTKDICEIAVSSFGLAIRHVPNALKSVEMFKLAVKSNPELIKELGRMDYSVYEEAIKANAAMIKYVPEEMLDRELCLIALNTDGRTIKFIEQTNEYCSIAISNTWRAIRFIENKTPELCMLAYNQDKRAAQFFEF